MKVGSSESIVPVAAVQLDVAEGDAHANVDHCLDTLHQAAAEGARVVVFPECGLTGYLFDDRSAAFAAALDANAPELTKITDAACALGVLAVVGYLEATDANTIYNTALITGRGVEPTRYRKAHLPCLGADRFATLGDVGPVVVPTPFGRVGVGLGYDMRFPEWLRTLALLGADVVAFPANWPTQAVDLADVVSRVRAMENRVFVVVANRGDAAHGIDFAGRSRIVSPGGAVLTSAERDERVVCGVVDLAQARDKTLVVSIGEYEAHLFNDRRPDLYGAITEPRRHA